MTNVIRQARRSAGLTQTELAARLGSTQPALARLERPGTNPTWSTITRALHAAGYQLELVPHSASAELDLGQLRERLALTPAQRLRVFERSQRSLLRLRRSSRRASRG